MADQPLVTLVIAYYNEEDFIEPMLATVLAQTDRRFALVLVDNMSTDASTARACEALAGASDIAVQFVREERQGQLFALMRGTAMATTKYVATLDADTFYPPHFVARALALLEADPAASAALAFNVGEDRRRKGGGAKWLWARIWPDLCHAGGAGHCYRRDMFADAGGFDDARWPFVLFDHEMAHRMRAQGRLAYAADHVVYASERRGDNSRSWTRLERALYKLVPRSRMDWFFYSFLGPRLAARGLNAVALREGAWRQP